MKNTHLLIDLDKITHNARTLVTLCQQAGLAVAGVVKATCGAPEVARAMLAGGVQWLADSRLENLRKLRRAGITYPLLLLRPPTMDQVDQAIELADISLNSELDTIASLGKAALQRGKNHQIILMVDVGDLREGVWPSEVMVTVDEVVHTRGVELVGLGTNVGCYGGLVPTATNTRVIIDLAEQIRAHFGLRLPYLSGGNTRTTTLLAAGEMPSGLHHLRLGEGILLGNDTLQGSLIPDTYQDAFLLKAAIIELKDKPSYPQGIIAQDAFGSVPAYIDKGWRRRAILAVGKQDLGAGALIPTQDGVEILGASSDHLIVDVTEGPGDLEIGSVLSFRLDYGSLVGLMTSPYVAKYYQGSV